MRTKKLFWHILPANLLITISALLAVIWYSEATLRQFYIKNLTSELTSRAQLISEQVSSLLTTERRTELNALCHRIGHKSSTRITVIKVSGTVVADSEESPAKMNNHSNRPEVKIALNGTIGTAQRWSATIGTNMLYVAIPLTYNSLANHKQLYILRTSMPVSAIDRQLHSIRKNIILGSIIVSVLASLLAIVVSRRISTPLEELEKQARQFAMGNFSTPFTVSPLSTEVKALSMAMNHMAQQIQERLNTITRQRNKLQTILNSMVEAVLVIDPDQKIVNINAAATHLFDIAADKAQGRNIQGLVRNLKFATLLDQCLLSRTPVSEIIDLNRGGEELFLQGSAVSLLDGDTNLGAVLVFNDITAIKRLENMRQDFVANVSHELMTPLTSIKGYSETILEIVNSEPEQSKKFLQIIIRQSDQLQAIVDDLLKLARLEQETEQTETVLTPSQLQNTIIASKQVCSAKATQKGITIIIDCPPELTVNMNASLLEQAVVNLLTNAIKYSAENSQVEVKCELLKTDDRNKIITINIRDYGTGIAAKHLPRLFERFYRSDKARSRKLGGTGLGLAIVKHIIQLHHGTVHVKSNLGQGSTFSIQLPFS